MEPYEIVINRLWRHRRGHFHPGRYRVPKHMPFDMAAQAVREGYGTRVETAPPPLPETPADAKPDDKPEDETEEPQRRRGRKRRSKGPAPENKAIAYEAPDDQPEVD